MTLPIMMDASNGYVVTADCGPRRDSVTMVTCDGLEWAQLFAHGWGDMEKAGVGSHLGSMLKDVYMLFIYTYIINLLYFILW